MAITIVIYSLAEFSFELTATISLNDFCKPVKTPWHAMPQKSFAISGFQRRP